jgi:hypothetical protein
MSSIRVLAGVFIVAAGLLCVAPAGQAEVAAPPAKSEREAKLERENAVLKQMVADAADEKARLEAKVRDLERKLAQRRVQAVPTPRPGSPPPATLPVPKGAVPKEFNGETFYVIPLTGSK